MLQCKCGIFKTKFNVNGNLQTVITDRLLCINSFQKTRNASVARQAMRKLANSIAANVRRGENDCQCGHTGTS